MKLTSNSPLDAANCSAADEVRRMVFAFDDHGRQQEVRRIANRVKALEDANLGLAGSSAFGGWSHMETAPHDGVSWILGYESDTGETGIIIFDGNPEEKYPDEHEDVWSDGYRVWNPTHWMPLPEPPTTDKS